MEKNQKTDGSFGTTSSSSRRRRRRREVAQSTVTTPTPVSPAQSATSSFTGSLGSSSYTYPEGDTSQSVITSQPGSTDGTLSGGSLATAVLGASSLASTLVAAVTGVTNNGSTGGAIASTLGGAIGGNTTSDPVTAAAVSALTSAASAVTSESWNTTINGTLGAITSGSNSTSASSLTTGSSSASTVSPGSRDFFSNSAYECMFGTGIIFGFMAVGYQCGVWWGRRYDSCRSGGNDDGVIYVEMGNLGGNGRNGHPPLDERSNSIDSGISEGPDDDVIVNQPGGAGGGGGSVRQALLYGRGNNNNGPSNVGNGGRGLGNQRQYSLSR